MPSKEYRSSPEVRTGFVRGNTFGYRPVQYSAIDGQAIFEGDIVLGSVEEMEQLATKVTDETGALEGVVITGAQFRWPRGVVPFTIDPALPNPARVTNAIAHWHSRTKIKFVARTSESNFVTFRPGSGCSSPVGMQGNEQFVTLASACTTGSTIHEIGHAVGLWHEQGREDRDLFIRVLWQNVESGKEHNFNQHITDGDDVGSYDFRSIMHYSTTAFSKNDKPTIETRHGESVGQRTGLSDGDVRAVHSMYFPSVPLILQSGVYTIQQKSNNRFVDAHEIEGKDFAVVTRPAQNNDTQRWVLNPLGGVYTIRQKSNNRIVDAYQGSGDDFAVVTRGDQNNDTQKWVLTDVGGLHTIQQKSNNQFMDAYQGSGDDFAVVTRDEQNDNTQKWDLTASGGNTFTIQEKSNGRFLDAHEIEEKDFALVTRPEQNNDTQKWTLTAVGLVCTIQQKSSGRFLDAYHGSGDDFALVTRTEQTDNTQKWIVIPTGNNTFTIQEKSNNQFVDAHEIEEKDFALVTRLEQNNDTQKWVIKPV